MIKLKRPAEVPAVLTSLAIKKFREDVEDFFKNYKPQSQERAPWPSNAIVNKVIQALTKAFPAKCAYCESPLQYNETTFDHFRPAKFARGFDKEYAEQHYWWLAFHWQNLLLACSSCNKAKSSWFPVKGARARIKATITQTRKENALLIDPAFDNPRLHLRFEESGRVLANSEKGATSIEILQLNRKDLIEKRRQSVEGTVDMMNQLAKADISNIRLLLRTIFYYLTMLYTDDRWDVGYIAFQRAFFAEIVNREPYHSRLFGKGKHLTQTLRNTQQELQELLKRYKIARFKIVAPQDPLQIATRIQIETVQIRNFKGIRELVFDMPAISTEKKNKVAPEPWMVLLGENGVGKSSVLQAICLALCGSNYINKMRLRPVDLIRIPDEGENGPPPTTDIVVSFKGEQEDIVVHITGQRIYSNLRQPAGYVLAYGSFRVPFTGRLRPEVTRSTIRCQNLFFQDTSLIDYNTWLCSLNETHFNRVAIALKELMSLGVKDLLVRDKRNKKVKVVAGNKTIPIDLYSDGYRSVFAMACDIMEKLVKEETHIAVAEGVVLIDELGTHLHPRWRMLVVSRLRSVFPKIQFITTTHDPLCLKGTKKGEVMVMKLDPKTKETVLLKDLPDPAGMRADQLLASEFFGLSSTVDADTEEKFNTY